MTARKPTPARGRRNGREGTELRAALDPNQPVFPYPSDLKEEFRPLWVETVNTKTADYWVTGDIPLLKMYCRCAHDVQRLSEEIDDEGEVIHNARGNPVVNPKIVVRGFAEARLMTLATKLRMQPSSRVDPRVEGKHNARKRGAQESAKQIADSGEGGEHDGLLAGATQLLN